MKQPEKKEPQKTEEKPIVTKPVQKPLPEIRSAKLDYDPAQNTRYHFERDIRSFASQVSLCLKDYMKNTKYSEAQVNREFLDGLYREFSYENYPLVESLEAIYGRLAFIAGLGRIEADVANAIDVEIRKLWYRIFRARLHVSTTDYNIFKNELAIPDSSPTFNYFISLHLNGVSNRIQAQVRSMKNDMNADT